MIMDSIVSYITYKDIAECLDIDTSTEIVQDGKLTIEGINEIYEKITHFCENYKKKHKSDPTEELRIEEENKLIQQSLDAYISPEAIAKKIDWHQKIEFINNYAQQGSKFEFLKDLAPTGLALVTFETEDGITFTIYPPIMILINDFHYLDTSVLPEFNYEEATAFDIIDLIGQALSLELLSVDESIAEYIY